MPRLLTLKEEVALLRQQLVHLHAIRDLRARISDGLDLRRTGQLQGLRDSLRLDRDRATAPDLVDCLREAVALLDEILGPATSLAAAA